MFFDSITTSSKIFVTRKLKKFYFIFLFLLFLCLGFFIYDYKYSDKQDFDALCEEMSQDFFACDALSQAFTLSKQSPVEQLLPCYSEKSYTATNQTDYLTKLKNIHPDRLNKEDAMLYKIMEDYLLRHKDDSNFLYLEQPLSPTGGIHTNLPVLLAEFPIQTSADVDLYFSILEAIPEYFESLSTYEADRKKKGYLIPTEDINEIISQCDQLCTKEGEKLFTESFLALLDRSKGHFSTAQKEYYLSKCNRIVHTLIIPAYKKLGDQLLVLREENVSQKSLYEMGRKDYYPYLLSLKTGSDKSVTEIEKMLNERFLTLAEEYNQLLPLLSTLPEAPFTMNEKVTPQQILSLLQDSMQEEFPQLPDGISATIYNVPDCLLQYTAPAYFFNPQIDCYTDNKIYVNPKEISDSLSLFTTLAHEGYPGHMLQSTYFLSTQSPNRIIKTALRSNFNYIGYIEGWAMYVELLSYRYFNKGDVCDEENTLLQRQNSLLRLNRELRICLYCLLDIRIHYYGNTIDDITPYLENIGITDTSEIESIYSYLLNEPATYASYYVGYLELLECKMLYQQYCENNNLPYSDKAFHTFYLKQGPCSFAQIKENINLQ